MFIRITSAVPEVSRTRESILSHIPLDRAIA